MNIVGLHSWRLSMSKAAELAKDGEVLTNSQIGGRRNIVINGALKWHKEVQVILVLVMVIMDINFR